MPTCSPERLAANRRNSLLSSGPKTPEGKRRSRANSYKHGMTGEGVVLSSEDAEKVAERFARMMEDFSPGTVAGCVLVKRTAMLSVRFDRSYEQEAANISTRVLSAETDLVDKRMAEAEHLLRTIMSEPATNHRRLMATPEGVDQLIGRWEKMKADIDNPEGCQWGHQHHFIADALCGRLCRSVDITPFSAWTMALLGNFECIKAERWVGIDGDDARRIHAMNQVFDLVEAEIAGLRAHRAAMDTRAIEAERSFATKRALFDASKEGILARKYEAATERGFYRALKELRQIEAECRPGIVTFDQDEVSEEVASILPEVPAEPEAPEEDEEAAEKPIPYPAQTNKRRPDPVAARTIRRARRNVVDKHRQDVANM